MTDCMFRLAAMSFNIRNQNGKIKVLKYMNAI